ncbi:HK97 family phage prohead protease [Acinetobacter towneri]|uniref:HK97 family phage prohead protease n=1 Tax=Acinetobacter towneri TaxID=202956 RepID=UPI001F6073B2|nr:HK97 family phage prohead protease [Acinetobacter towneri]UNT61040.1 HK97 family phage prohead protease [Acinetobacter towneri]
MKKAYSLLQVKSFDAEQRIIKGIASTPSPDRSDDIVDPQGAKFALPIPFLWQHMHSQPIGEVTEAVVTDKGIEVTVQIAKIEEEGKLKDRIDEAWQSIKSGLVKGLSIGFRGITVEDIPRSWGLHFKEWEWFELSAVTVPANAEASIVEIKTISKSFEQQEKSALGDELPKTKVEKPTAGDSAEKKHVTVKLNCPTKGGVKL